MEGTIPLAGMFWNPLNINYSNYLLSKILRVSFSKSNQEG